jgi:hypothetical protein
VKSVFRASQRKITLLLRINLSWRSGVYHVLLRRHSASPSTEFRSCAWRLAFEVSSAGAWGAIAGTVKLFLPPRQSRGLPGSSTSYL